MKPVTISPEEHEVIRTIGFVQMARPNITDETADIFVQKLSKVLDMQEQGHVGMGLTQRICGLYRNRVLELTNKNENN